LELDREPEGPQRDTRPAHADDAIVELANGKLGYSDPSGKFNAYISRDGSVRFQDAKSVQTKVCLATVCVGGGSPKQVKRGGKEYRTTMGVEFAPLLVGFIGRYGRQVGTNRLETAFLERTYDMRLEMSLRWQRRQIIKQLAALRDHLDELWIDPRFDDHSARRRIMRELWDECDADVQELPSLADAMPRELLLARKQAAAKARKVIENYYLERSGEPLW
jgi:hypothetical protein